MIEPEKAQAWTTVVSGVVSVAGQLKALFAAEPAGEAKALVVDLGEKVLQLRLAGIAVGEENIRLRERLMELERSADLAARVVYEGRAVKLRDPGPGEPPGLCCLQCWEGDRRLASVFLNGQCRDCREDLPSTRVRTRGR